MRVYSYEVTIESMPFKMIFYGGEMAPDAEDVELALRRRGLEMYLMRKIEIRAIMHKLEHGRRPGQRGAYVDHTEDDSRYPNAKLWQLWRGSVRSRLGEEYRAGYKRRKVSSGESDDSVDSRDRGISEGGAGSSGDSAGM